MATTKSKAKRGRPKGNGGGIASMSDAQKRKLAQTIAKLRKQKVSWDEIKEETGISSALVGRDLLRDYGSEDLIREHTGGGNSGGSKRKSTSSRSTSRAKATPAKKRKVTVKRGRGGRNPS